MRTETSLTVPTISDVSAVVQLVCSVEGLTIRTESHQLCRETHQLAVEASLYNEYPPSIPSNSVDARRHLLPEPVHPSNRLFGQANEDRNGIDLVFPFFVHLFVYRTCICNRTAEDSSISLSHSYGTSILSFIRLFTFSFSCLQ